MKDYIVENYEEELREVFRDTMESLFEHNLYNKSFSNQLESDDDDLDTFQQRIKWWMVVVDRGGPIPYDVYEYTFNELYMLYRKIIDPDMPKLVEKLRERQIIP